VADLIRYARCGPCEPVENRDPCGFSPLLGQKILTDHEKVPGNAVNRARPGASTRPRGVVLVETRRP